MAGGKILERLLFNLESNSAELTKGLNDAKGQINKFTSTLGKITAVAGVAFGVKEIVSFGAEVSKLAGQAEGVRNAFNKLPGATALLRDLQAATQGTVNEMQLMQRAVQFQNFGLDLAQLPKLLQFATLRAQQTGQSVDYLVDSIVTGLGRKSVLVLDNLGISSQQLNTEIQKTGDFFGSVGTIVDKELTKMGGLLDNTVVKANRLDASWTNLKVSIGNFINQSKLSEGLDLISLIIDPNRAKTADEIKSMTQQLKFWNEERKKARAEGDRDAEIFAIQTIAKLSAILGDVKDKSVEFREEKKKLGPVIDTINSLTERLTVLQQLQLDQSGQALAATNREIKSIEEKIKALKELGLETRELSRAQKETEKSLTKIGEPKKKNTAGIIVPEASTKPQAPTNVEILTTEQDKVYQLATAWDYLGEIMQDVAETKGVNALESLGGAVANLLTGAKADFKSFSQIVVSSIFTIIEALYKQMIAQVLASSAKGGLLGLFAGGVALGAFKALFQKEVGAFYNGGVSKGGLYSVAEHGKELLHIPEGGRVYNHSDTRKLLGDAGNSNTTVHVVGRIGHDAIYLSNQEGARRFENTN